MFRFVLLLAFIPALVLGQTLVTPCAAGLPPPTNVNVHGCVQPPCAVPQGTTSLMDVTFTAPFDAQELTPIVTATALGLTLPYELEASLRVVCNHLGATSCPLALGDEATWYFAFLVNAIYPPIGVTVQLQLVDHANRPHMCVVVPIQVVTPQN